MPCIKLHSSYNNVAMKDPHFVHVSLEIATAGSWIYSQLKMKRHLRRNPLTTDLAIRSGSHISLQVLTKICLQRGITHIYRTFTLARIQADANIQITPSVWPVAARQGVGRAKDGIYFLEHKARVSVSKVSLAPKVREDLQPDNWRRDRYSQKYSANFKAWMFHIWLNYL